MSLLKHLRGTKAKPEVYGDVEPQVGFKLAYNSRTGEVSVKVLGAKQLPTSYGTTKTQGYLIKLTVFPQKDKFETKIVEQSWPTFDEEYKFKIQSNSTSGDSLKGKFVSFTAYALLYGEQEKRKENTTFISRFVALTGFHRQKRDSRIRKSFRSSLSNRRTIGSVTYNLELKNFSVRISDDVRSTPEIWRGLKEISSGVVNNSKDNKKGSVEVTMLYTVSEEGNKDIIEIGVSKLRCTVQTMEEHERLGGKLYLKISAFEMDDVIQKMKSDKFDPTISLKLEKKSARLKVKVDEYSCTQLRILIKLMCTPLLGHKLELGRIEIDSRSDIWKDMMKTPMVAITKVINLE
ncbi:uncharacterized protein LOC123311488 [Coccinella septempunctata]|uniref:uncharacterized protein LOC123311488 n=1 Tax=Coccinella septempunctata TaxID=41139 RepID=UPI001D080D84|nr:uncharacterized protein LOC123311488 [Coccinella septempunctata]